MTVSYPTVEQNCDALAPWRRVDIKPVVPYFQGHVTHTYFNTSPESPDGKHVLYFRSATANGEHGDIRIVNRTTGREAIVAENVATEDAHRVACQQWCNGGNHIVYHHPHEGSWYVRVVDVQTLESKLIAKDRQLGFAATASPWVPLYGCHWNPGCHRHLELANVVTGERRTVVTVNDVIAEFCRWIDRQFGSRDVSIFFPIVSPDSSKVFFKLAQPSGRDDFRSPEASKRLGRFVYDLAGKRFLHVMDAWAHPAWSPDSMAIIERGNVVVNARSGIARQIAPSCFSEHPSFAPDGKLIVTDANVSRCDGGGADEWGVAVGATTVDQHVVLHRFANSGGARSWRRNHPHPVFSPDGRRVYYNVSQGQWTTLMVAEGVG